MIFDNYEAYSGITLLLGAILFSFQIYGDFSGYSDIAIGVAKLLGFRLMQNFAYPYFSRDIAEFWRRWHISLSTWFRDYLYIPLGGSRRALAINIRNVLIVFTVSGFWHGANWTFIAWGLLNAFLFLPLLIFKRNRTNTDVVAQSSSFPTLKEIVQVTWTFLLTSLVWVFFRSPDIATAFGYISGIFSGPLEHSSIVDSYNFLIWEIGYLLPVGVTTFLIVEWTQRKKEHGLQNFLIDDPLIVRWFTYIVMCISIILSSSEEVQFIYFQF